MTPILSAAHLIDVALSVSASEINGQTLTAAIAPNRSNSAKKC